jgi:hypothetical protein
MNEYTKARLHEKLENDVAGRFGPTLRAWEDAGCSVQPVITLQEKKDGRHGAEVLFLVAREGKTREVSALYTYVLQAHGKPAHWYMYDGPGD